MIRAQAPQPFASFVASRAALLAVICLVGVSSASALGGDERVLVDSHRAQAITFGGVPWSHMKGGGIEGSGGGNTVFATDQLGSGDFDVRVHLALAELGGKWSGYQFANDCFFAFDGPNRSVLINGPHFGGKTIQIGDATRWIKPKVAFVLDVRRVGTKITFSIDQNVVYELEFGDDRAGRIGLFPAGTSLQLFEWTVNGNIEAQVVSTELEQLQPKINSAIERGVHALLMRQQRDGSWASSQRCFPGGMTSLAVYALLKSGLKPSHPAIVRALHYLAPIVPTETYASGLMLMAYEATGDPKLHDKMKTIVQNLVEWQRLGCWSYPRTPRDGWEGWTNGTGNPDLSNTQYAVLGLRAAMHAGLDVPPKVWLDVVDNVLKHQDQPTTVDVVRTGNDTGSDKRPIAGFRYNLDPGSRGSMTAAGISALFVAREGLGKRLVGQAATDVGRSIQMGLNWLDQYFAVDKNPMGDAPWVYYWLYGVERVGGLLEIDDLGHHDWYLEGAKWIVSKQADEGTWAAGAGAPVVSEETDTCFAVLFLRKATRAKPMTDSGAREFFAKSDDSKLPVRVTAEGNGAFLVRIAGFSEQVIADDTSAEIGGLRIASVEWLVDGRTRATIAGDPSKPWTSADFAAKFELEDPGDASLVARVHLVAHDAAASDTSPSVVVESKPVVLHCDGVAQPWMLDLVDRRSRNLLAGRPMTVTSSSVNGGDAGTRAFDGLESTRWMCKNDDPNPTLTVDLQKPVVGSTLVLETHCTSPMLRGQHDVIQKISVRVNRGKEAIEAVADPDELKPIVVPLGKNVSVSRLEIRILARKPGARWAGFAGFTEIALEK